VTFLVSLVALSGASWHTFRAHSISVRYPPNWFATARDLTPVTGPAQILAVATFRLPGGSGGADGCEPKEALDRMPAGGAFIFGWEYGAGSGMLKRDFPLRPKHFRLKNYARYECLGASFMLRFRQAGRFFQIHVALGRRASRATRITVLRILDTFSAKPT
jgi:hypothetical protein